MRVPVVFHWNFICEGDLVFTIQTLTQGSFAAFGEVIEHRGEARRHPVTIDFSSEHEDIQQQFWVSRMQSASQLPCKVTQLERHPFSDQAFVSLRGNQFLVVVCPNTADGSPDISGVRAFVAGPAQGIVYRRNVWHAPLAAIDEPADFFVSMALTKRAENDEFFDLPEPLNIHSGFARQ